jgi:hypothetical protein
MSDVQPYGCQKVSNTFGNLAVAFPGFPEEKSGNPAGTSGPVTWPTCNQAVA